MERESVVSSHIVSIGYDPLTLEVEFKGGSVWQYFKVPESVHLEFMSSESKGKFFHKNIKEKYKELKVG